MLADSFTGGRRRVDKLNGGMAKEDQEAIMAELSKGAASFIRVLFASIIIGMGTHLESLYHVWRIGQPRTLLEWIQELGRSGRDGGDRGMSLCSTEGSQLGALYETLLYFKHLSSFSICLAL